MIFHGTTWVGMRAMLGVAGVAVHGAADRGVVRNLWVGISGLQLTPE